MKLDCFIWQFDMDYPPELPADEVMPIQTVYVKALDGTTWMSAFDTHQRAVSGRQALRDLCEIYDQAGVGLVPWGVVHCPDVETAYQEGLLAGLAAGAVAGTFIVDLEDGPGFFQGGPPEIDAWFRGFAEGGGLVVWLCLDSREEHIDQYFFSHWWSHAECTRVMPQAYWTDFGIDPIEGLRKVIEPLRQRGVSETRIYPVLPASALNIMVGIGYCEGRGLPGVSLWRRGTIDSGMAAWLERARKYSPLEPATAETPAEPRPKEQLLTQLSEVEQALARLRELADLLP